jgi:hypothetical protein
MDHALVVFHAQIKRDRLSLSIQCISLRASTVNQLEFICRDPTVVCFELHSLLVLTD